METSYFEVMRITLAFAGPLVFIASIFFTFTVMLSASINKLLAILGIATLGPVGMSVAYLFGPLLLPELPWLGIACFLGYGFLFNWLLVYAVHYGGRSTLESWKKQLQKPQFLPAERNRSAIPTSRPHLVNYQSRLVAPQGRVLT